MSCNACTNNWGSAVYTFNYSIIIVIGNIAIIVYVIETSVWLCSVLKQTVRLIVNNLIIKTNSTCMHDYKNSFSYCSYLMRKF